MTNELNMLNTYLNNQVVIEEIPASAGMTITKKLGYCYLPDCPLNCCSLSLNKTLKVVKLP